MRKKPIILDHLINRLKKLRMVKYEKKKAFNIKIQKIKCIVIQKKLEIEKKRIKTKKKFENRQLVL